jgi:hypothetical protein
MIYGNAHVHGWFPARAATHWELSTRVGIAMVGRMRDNPS